MKLKIKLLKYLALTRNHLNSPTKVYIFFSMIIWSGFIRFLLIFFPVGKITKFVALPKNRLNFDFDELLLFFNWLKRLKIIKTTGDCLPSSLVHYRFLLLTGEEPTLIIGFNNSQGHAWVEISGEIISEPVNKSTNFKPLLYLLAGDTGFSSAK